MLNKNNYIFRSKIHIIWQSIKSDFFEKHYFCLTGGCIYLYMQIS